MGFQFVYPTRGGTLPGSRGQSLADQFTPGQYLVKNKPQPQQQPITKSQPQPKQSLFSKIKTTAIKDAKTVGNTANKAVIAVGKPGVDLATGQGGKLAHDTAQLASDVTGGTSSYTGANAANIAKLTAARVTGNKTALANAKTASRQNLGLDNNNNITKKSLIKLGGNAVNAGSLVVGGAEAKVLGAAKKEGASLLGKRVAKDAAIGATAGTAQTYAQNPNATKKEAFTGAAAGGLLGGTIPVAAKGFGKASEALSPHTAKALDHVMNTVRAPRSLVEKAKTQGLLDAARQKDVAKAAIEVPKLEQKIELINAKKADGKFTNVDKVKVKQLEDQKKAYGIPTDQTSATATQPQAQLPSEAKLEQPPVPKGSSQPLPDSSKNPEQFAHDYIANNRPQAEADYAARTAKEFGVTKNNVVSGDEAKFIIPGMGPDKSVPYHNTASQFAKDHYKKLLADESTKDKPVMITAGGSGAGKTSALRTYAHQEGETLDNYAAIVDTNLTDMKGAESRIQAARATGRPVYINYVYRHPKQAYEGVIGRANRTGRVVTDKIHAETHVGSLDTIKKLVEKYKDDPNVDINIIDNSFGQDNHKLIPENRVLDFLDKRSYTKEQVHAHAHEALDNAIKNGEITHEQKINFIHQEGEQQGAGKSVSASNGQRTTQAVRGSEQKAEVTPKVSARKETEYKPNKGEPVNVPIEQPKIKQPEIKTSKLANSTEQKAIDKKLTQGFEGKPEYAKVNTKDQAKAASELLKSDPERSTRIALGQELPPEHLLPESVYIAVENQALKDGNVDLLRRLATEGSLSSEATGMGQRIRMLGERDPDSAVSAMRKLAEARAKAIEKRTGKPVTKAVSEEVKQIRAVKPKVTKENWSSFVEGLKC